MLIYCCCSVTKLYPTRWPHGLQHMSFSISWSLLRFMFIDSVVLSNHLILCCLLLLLPSISPKHQGLFQRVISSHQDPDGGKDRRQKEKRATEDEMVGWHHQFNGHELGKLQKSVRERKAWHAAVHRVAYISVDTKSWTWLGSWTTKTLGI